MATLTETDEARILAAIAQGEAEVRFADGRTVKYRSVSEMREALALARSERTVPMNRTTLAGFRRD
jgi:hypothetical protein